MSHGVIKVEVEASTKKATASIKKLKSDLQSSSSKGIDFGGLENITGKFADFTKLDSSAISKFKDAFSSLNKLGVGKVGLGAAGAFGAIAASAKFAVDQIDRMVDSGMDAEKQFQKINVTLSTLDKNLGGTGRSFDVFTKDIQLMAANGVNSVDDLNTAAASLMTAFDGNSSKAKKMLAIFDDLSAGTGVQVSDWASMASEVSLTGVSIKDLTRLSNRGIPIYQALGDAMGVTAEQAEAMAKAGQVGTEDWFTAIDKLSQRYKGLSQQLSSSTLEGAQSTFDQSKQLMYQGASAGYSEERIKYLNEASEEMQKFAENPAWQETIGILGGLKGGLENFGDTLGKIGERLANGSLITALKMLDSIGFTDFQGAIDAGVKAKQSKEVADVVRGAAEALEGKLTTGQMEDVLTKMQTGRLKYQEAGLSEEHWNNLISKLEKAIEESKDKDTYNAAKAAEEAKQARMQDAVLKYGTLEDKVKAVSGKNYAQQIFGPEELQSAIDALKKQLLEGNIEDVKTAENTLKTLENIQKEYQQETQNAAKAEKELADARKKAADEALNAKMADDKAYIEGKATIGKQITDAQGDYDTITKKLEEQQAIRAQIADEEAHGIYRKKWGNLNVSEVSTKEAELLKQQQESGKKLADLKKSYDDYDKNWKQARTQIQNFFTSVVAGSVVPVKGVPITG